MVSETNGVIGDVQGTSGPQIRLTSLSNCAG
jgi:hypothetical protein